MAARWDDQVIQAFVTMRSLVQDAESLAGDPQKVSELRESWDVLESAGIFGELIRQIEHSLS